MTQILAILFFTLFIGIIWVKANEFMFRDKFSPFNLLFFIWVFPFVISFTNLSDLQQGISAWPLIILFVVTTVMVATLIVPPLTPRYIFSPTYNEGVKCRLSKVSLDRLLLLAFILVLIALSAKIAAEFSEGIPLFAYLKDTANSASLHRIGKDSKLQILAEALAIGGMLSWYCALRSSGRPLMRTAALLLATIPLVVGVLKVSKSDIAEPAFLYFMVYYYTRPSSWRISVAKLLIPTVMMLIVLLGVTEIRLSGQGAGNYADVIEFKGESLPSALRVLLAQPYGYVALNFENFSRYVDMSNSLLRLGTSMFRPLFSVVMQGSIPNEMLDGLDLHEMAPAANVGTFLRDLYVEGGVTMCLVGAFWNALLIRLAYNHFRRRQDDISMVIYVTLLFPWIWIFFTNAFSILTVYSNCFLAVVILLLSQSGKDYPRFSVISPKSSLSRVE